MNPMNPLDHAQQSAEKAKAAQEYAETFPHYKTYRECQKKAFAKGSATLVTGAATLYIIQEIFKKKLPYERNAYLMLPLLIGSVASYAVTRHETKICNHMWMALEEKHSVLTPVAERREQMDKDEETLVL